MTTPMKALAADLLFTRAPTLLPQAVHVHVKGLVPGAEMTAPTARSPGSFFRFPGQKLEIAFIASDQPPPLSGYAEALLNESEWPEASKVVRGVSSIVTLAELHGETLPDDERLALFTRVLVACARALNAEGAFWTPAHRLLSPGAIEGLLEEAGRRRVVGR